MIARYTRPEMGRIWTPERRLRIWLDVELAEAAFGTTKDLKVDTAVVCTTCHGDGASPGSKPVVCETCRGAGEVAQVQRRTRAGEEVLDGVGPGVADEDVVPGAAFRPARRASARTDLHDGSGGGEAVAPPAQWRQQPGAPRGGDEAAVVRSGSCRHVQCNGNG